MHPSVLSLDIGTSAAKAVLFDPDGSELAVAEQAYQLKTPQPGHAELDPGEVFQAVLQVIKTITGDKPAKTGILAAALSTQGGSLLAVDAHGEPVHPIITWLDQRASPIVHEWQASGMHSIIRERSGWQPQPGLPLPVICALRRDQPDVFTAADKFLSVNDYLTFKLTGQFVTNPSMAGEMLLTDVQSGAYSQELCDLAGIQISQLSTIMDSDAICGTILPEISHLTGLPERLPLINGGQDHACEALALGMTLPGQYLLACGTAWVINGITGTPDAGAIPQQMDLNSHVLPGRWIASQFLGGLGAGMEWWLDRFWQAPPPANPLPRKARLQSFNAALERTRPGSSGLLFIPVSGIPGRQPTGGYINLRLDHTREDMGRAVLESAAFELRRALKEIHNSGLSVNRLWMVGGAAHSPHWPGILADVTGIPIQLTRYRHGPALGAAVLACRRLGLLDQEPDWISTLEIQPDPEHFSLYDDTYNAYIQLTGDPST